MATGSSQMSAAFDSYVEELIKLDERWAFSAKYRLAKFLHSLPEFHTATPLVKAVILHIVASGQYRDRVGDYGGSVAVQALQQVEQAEGQFRPHEKVFVAGLNNLKTSICLRISFGESQLKISGMGRVEEAEYQVCCLHPTSTTSSELAY